MIPGWDQGLPADPFPGTKVPGNSPGLAWPGRILAISSQVSLKILKNFQDENHQIFQGNLESLSACQPVL